MIKYDKTKWVDGTTVLRASHMEKIEKGITDIIDYNNSIYTDEAKRKENEIKREEEHNKKLEEINSSIKDIQTDYDSLQKVIIDENASANLQNQINDVNSQLAYNINNLVDREVNIKFPPYPFEPCKMNGEDDTESFLNIYNNFDNIFIPNGTLLIKGFELKPSKKINKKEN